MDAQTEEAVISNLETLFANDTIYCYIVSTRLSFFIKKTLLFTVLENALRRLLPPFRSHPSQGMRGHGLPSSLPNFVQAFTHANPPNKHTTVPTNRVMS